jgi:DNA polymerase-4
MAVSRARGLCPGLRAVRPRFSAYTEASAELFDLFRDTAPTVEGLSLEEAFLDVSGLREILGSPREIATRLRRRAREEVGLPLTVGIARTKVLAKMASRAAKPDGLLIVEPAGERAFLHPLPVEALWGVGPATAERLHSHGLRTVGQIADTAEDELVALLGSHAGAHLHAVANNRDRRRVRSGRRRSSFGSQSALGRRPRTRADLDAVLVSLVDRVTRRMRGAGRAGRTVVLRLRFGDFKRASRSCTLPVAASGSRPILRAARGLLAAAMPLIERRGITLLGVAVSNLERPGGVQLELPFERWDALDAALDELRDRFGPDAIRRAATLSRDPGLTPWLRPGEKRPR